MALCSMLAFWCGRDTAMMDKLFRRSGLMRQVKANDLSRVYSEWCSRNNEYCMSSTKFGTEIAKRYQKMHIRSGWIYCNICLNQEYAPYQISIGKEA